ncbi:MULTISPECIES: hypothetical protein [Methanothermobacter]|nr:MULTISPECIES: hypothetical protein [Methanothermobacter]MDI6817910.1 hypothetical protein [Methanothermobacter thermautotrophicus]BAM69768.1 conserved hypothetical protein [Methanothermobacter sp. CaT2]BAZ98639.1 hypothetical protein tca_00564 [Methanothermobacter sp. EMTCatA1]
MHTFISNNPGSGRGQAAAEYMMLAGFSVLLALIFAGQIQLQLELMEAHSAARTGASEGAFTDTIAVYPGVTFDEYQSLKPELLEPSSVRVVRVELIEDGYSSTYGRRKFRLRAWLSGPPMKPSLRESISDRVNFCIRRSISRTFGTENLTNTYHNPAFSDHYVFTTSEAIWVQ